MITIEQISQELAQLDQHQLQQVAEFITQLKPSQKPKQRLSDFYGALPATLPYPGKEALRQSITDYLAQKHHLTES
jgi:hypothetical protein